VKLRWLLVVLLPVALLLGCLAPLMILGILAESAFTDVGASSTAAADIPPVALNAYQAAAPKCPGLSWTVLAGIGKVETGHGSADGHHLDPATGQAVPAQPPLHSAAVNLIGGQGVYAYGPMQFLPGTWASYGDQVAPGLDNADMAAGPVQNINYAAKAAALLLCNAAASGGHDFAIKSDDDVRRAVNAYSGNTAGYYDHVMAAAQLYSSTGTDGIAITPGEVEAGHGQVVLIGDSILHRANAVGKLTDKLQKRGWDVTVDASDSRSFTGKGVDPPTDGIDALSADRDALAGADAVVVGLGTNGGAAGDPAAVAADFTHDVEDFIVRIRQVNKRATVFWINLASPSLGPLNQVRNGVLDAEEQADHLKVIDWFGQVYGGTDVADASLVDADNTHPSIPTGSDALANLIATDVDTGSWEAIVAGRNNVTNLAAVGDLGLRLVLASTKFIGIPYANGNPAKGDPSIVYSGHPGDSWVAGHFVDRDPRYSTLDCSGLVNAAMFLAFGQRYNYCSSDYRSDANFVHVSMDSLRPGDLVLHGDCGLGASGHIAIVASYDVGSHAAVIIDAARHGTVVGFRAARDVDSWEFTDAFRYTGRYAARG
jgi:cell wall-associated NlpC family hydrolase